MNTSPISADTVFEIPAGVRLLEALRRAGADVNAPCGGKGTCGKCFVWLADQPDGPYRQVPSCQTVLKQTGYVRLTEPGTQPALQSGTQSGALPGAQPGASSAEAPIHWPERIGAAVDLGTTTVLTRLLDMESGRTLGEISEWNAQGAFGADVISRTQYTMEHSDGLEILSGRIRRQIESQIGRLLEGSGKRASDLAGVTIAGNTVMEHILAGLSPESISKAPFTPVSLFDEEDGTASLSGWEGMPKVTLAPCVAGYVGGDITAGMLALEAIERTRLPEDAASVKSSGAYTLFLDIGTNGEMALIGPKEIVCCAVACGPAFEGANIRCGMRAEPGAISHAYLENGTLVTEVIGDVPAKGISGSGLIDVIAGLIQEEEIDETGRLEGGEMLTDAGEADPAKSRTADPAGKSGKPERVYYLDEDRRVFLAQSDIRQVQLAKAAVAAGIQVLMDSVGIEASEIRHLYIAGNFGYHMDMSHAAVIGMIPEALAGCAEAVGNTSLAGAALLTWDPEAKTRLNRIREQCRYVELSGHPDFNEAYVDHMMFGDDE